MFLQIVLNKLYRDSRADVRAANFADRLRKQNAKLEKLQGELEWLILRSPDPKKIQKKLNEHAKLVGEINQSLRQILGFEFASYQKDVKEPQDLIVNFIETLSTEHKSIRDPALKKHISDLLNDIGKHYEVINAGISKMVAEIDEAYSREISGVTSAYSLSVGDVDKLTELIEARELQKKSLDHEIARVIKGVGDTTDKIKEYLKKESEGKFEGIAALLKGKVVVNNWYRLGDNEFRQGKDGKWRVRNAGVNVPGVLASRKELEGSGIYHYELLNALEHFRKNYSDLMEFIWQRAQLSKQVMGNIGYIEHKLLIAQQKVEAEVKANLSGNKEVLAALAAMERTEKTTVIQAEKRFLAQGQETLATLAASSNRVAAVLAAVVGAGILAGAAAVAERSYVSNVEKPAQIMAEAKSDVKIMVKKHIEKEDVIKTFEIEAHFPYNVSDKTMDNMDDLNHFFHKIIGALIEAARDAGYGDDYVRFAKEQGIVLEVSITGYASPEGKEYYNLKLSDKRAAFIEAQLAEWGSRTGIVVVTTNVMGKGELGEQEVLQKVGKLLENKALGDKIIENLSNSLDHQGQKTLKALWNKYQKAPDTKRQKKALEKILHAVQKMSKVDAMLLAPYRKAVLKVGMKYQKEHTIVDVIKIPDDELPPQVKSSPIPATHVFDAADIQENTVRFDPFVTPVLSPKFRGRGGFQTPYRGVGGGVRGRHQGPVGRWG
ncbi:hypothetical protein HZC30_00025 [Candidatus Woesearchaeota archaeon]|nr:hypothetical protein [Candidatus Woesearchaeota archaeon]